MSIFLLNVGAPIQGVSAHCYHAFPTSGNYSFYELYDSQRPCSFAGSYFFGKWSVLSSKAIAPSKIYNLCLSTNLL